MATDPFLSILAHTGAGRGSAAVKLLESGQEPAQMSVDDIADIMSGGLKTEDTIADSVPEPDGFSDVGDGWSPQLGDVTPDIEDVRSSGGIDDDFLPVPPIGSGGYAPAPAAPRATQADVTEDDDVEDAPDVSQSGNPLVDEFRRRYGDDAWDDDDGDDDEDEDDEDDDEDDDSPSRFRKPNLSLGKFHPQRVFAEHPEWKRPAAVGSGVGVVALAAALFFSGSPASNTPPPAAPPVVAGAQEEDAPTHDITELIPEQVSARCPSGSTNANLAWSGSSKDAWVCMRIKGKNGYLDNSILNISFGKPVVVTSVFTSLGWNDEGGDPNGNSRWNEHMVANKLVYRIGKKNYFQSIDSPTSAGATYVFPNGGIAATNMSITIAGSVSPGEVQVKDIDPNAGIGPGGDQVVNDEAEKSIALSTVRIEGYYPGGQ